MLGGGYSLYKNEQCTAILTDSVYSSHRGKFNQPINTRLVAYHIAGKFGRN